MANESGTTLVLRDDDGAYYLITDEMLAQARVPDERQKEMEGWTDDGDTSGFATTGIGFTLLGAHMTDILVSSAPPDRGVKIDDKNVM
jgi:hypothetical protein